MARLRTIQAETKFIVSATHLDVLHLDDDLDNISDALTYVLRDLFSFGSGNQQVNLQWHGRRTVIGAWEELDLDGVLQDKFGGWLTYTKLKIILFRNRNLTTALRVFGTCAGVDQVTSVLSVGDESLVVPPDSGLLMVAPLAGYAVVPGVSDHIRITPAGPGVTYDVVLLGVGTRIEDEPTTTTPAPTTTTAPPVTTTAP